MEFVGYTIDGHIYPQASIVSRSDSDWIGLNCDASRNIPRDALQVPKHDLMMGDFNDYGDCIQTDWMNCPNWYDRGYHWRGFIPKGGEISGRDIWRVKEVIPSPNDTNLVCIHRGVYRERARLSSDLEAWCKRLVTALRLSHVPRPVQPEDELIRSSYIRKEMALRAAALHARQYHDRLGFFLWMIATYSEILQEPNSKIDWEQLQDRWDTTIAQEKTGYIVDLVRDWQEFGFGFCVQERVPVYYPWTSLLKTDKRFARFNPSYLGAIDVTDGAPYSPVLPFTPKWTDPDFDYFLQPFRLGSAKPEIIPYKGQLAPTTDYAVDYEGWSRRSIDNPTKKLLLTACAHRIIQDPSHTARIFLRYLPLPGTSPDVTGFDSSDDEEDSSIPITKADMRYERERFKFKYAPCAGEVIDPVTAQRSKIRAPLTIGHTLPSVQVSSHIPSQDQRVSPPRSAPTPSAGRTPEASPNPVPKINIFPDVEDIAPTVYQTPVEDLEPPSRAPTPSAELDPFSTASDPPEAQDVVMDVPTDTATSTPQSLPTLLARMNAEEGEIQNPESSQAVPVEEPMVVDSSANAATPLTLEQRLGVTDTSSLLGRLDIPKPHWRDQPPKAKKKKQAVVYPPAMNARPPYRRPEPPAPREEPAWSQSTTVSWGQSEGNSWGESWGDSWGNEPSDQGGAAGDKPAWGPSIDSGRSSGKGKERAHTPMAGVEDSSSRQRGDDASSYSSSSSRKRAASSTMHPDSYRAPPLRQISQSSSHPPSRRAFEQAAYNFPSGLPAWVTPFLSDFLTGSSKVTTHAHQCFGQPIPPDLWSQNYFNMGYLLFANESSVLRMRLWAMVHRNMNIKDVLSWALERHIPFQIAVPKADLQRFERAFSEAEMEAAFYYSRNYSVDAVVWSDQPQGCAAYSARIIQLLSRPNARAFRFRGGLASRLASHYGPRSLSTSVAAGPSAAMVEHGSFDKIDKHDELKLVIEAASVTDIRTLFGFYAPLPGGKKDTVRSLWPEESLFMAKFYPWDGEWNGDCERWFRERAEQIRLGNASPLTNGEWYGSLQSWCREIRSTEGTRVPHSSWENLDMACRTRFGVASGWRGRPFRSITLPEN